MRLSHITTVFSKGCTFVKTLCIGTLSLLLRYIISFGWIVRPQALHTTRVLLCPLQFGLGTPTPEYRRGDRSRVLHVPKQKRSVTKLYVCR
jgi:hypothetical protein